MDPDDLNTQRLCYAGFPFYAICIATTTPTTAAVDAATAQNTKGRTCYFNFLLFTLFSSYYWKITPHPLSLSFILFSTKLFFILSLSLFLFLFSNFKQSPFSSLSLSLIFSFMLNFFFILFFFRETFWKIHLCFLRW